jgi:hypothetical protein
MKKSRSKNKKRRDSEIDWSQADSVQDKKSTKNKQKSSNSKSRKVQIDELEGAPGAPRSTADSKVASPPLIEDDDNHVHLHVNEENMDGSDKTMYYNMTICHSIAIHDEHKFNQFMKKMAYQFQIDRTDKLAFSVIENYADSNFMEIKRMVELKEIRKYYSLALKYCIKKKRDVIAFDLIKFSQEMVFHLMVDQEDIMLLI